MSSPSEKPAWKQRAVERSIQPSKARAEKRVQRFLDSAQLIMDEKGSTDFTVQEIIDRSQQSLRSFYLHFSGKHELLLALFEQALNHATEQMRAAAIAHDKPLDQFKAAVELLFELCKPDPDSQRPLFTDFASQLLISHPAQVRMALAPLLALFTELLAEASESGELRQDIAAHRMATLVMQTVMFTAQSSGMSEDGDRHPITAEEIWNFCSYGFARD